MRSMLLSLNQSFTTAVDRTFLYVYIYIYTLNSIILNGI